MSQTSATATAEQGSKRNNHWLMIGLIGFWASEILLIQHYSTFPDAAIPVDRAIKDAARRMVLNVAACTILVCVLRSWMLRLAFAIGLLATNGLLVYANYFGTPLSWPIMSSQWREGVAVGDHGMSLLNGWILAATILALAVKVILQNTAQPASYSLKKRFRWVRNATLVYLIFGIALAGFHKPISRIHMGSPEYIYGYTVAWITEAVTFDHRQLLNDAIATASKQSKLLSEQESPLQLGKHVVVVQVESLDFNVVNARVDGQPVMPFLAQLSENSMHYAVVPFHDTGSSEADFSTLTTSTPNGTINPFQVPGFPYDRALPWLAQQRGYRTVALHGNTGEFFHRRTAYDQMGFDELYFTEELEPLDITGKWDRELLMHTAKLLQESDEPTFAFVITITSHGPFERLPPDQRKLIDHPINRSEHYVNSMKYVDDAMKDFVNELPPETTLMVYGDHGSQVYGYTESTSQRNNVPWLIYRKGKNLASCQKTRTQNFAFSGELSQLDMVCFLRDQFAIASPNLEYVAQNPDQKQQSVSAGSRH